MVNVSSVIPHPQNQSQYLSEFELVCPIPSTIDWENWQTNQNNYSALVPATHLVHHDQWHKIMKRTRIKEIRIGNKTVDFIHLVSSTNQGQWTCCNAQNCLVLFNRCMP